VTRSWLNGCQTVKREEHPVEDLASNRIGENPLYGMNGGGWENMGRKSAACVPALLD
jgi:hypothetical protein